MSQPKVEIPLEIKDDTDGVSKNIVGTLVLYVNPIFRPHIAEENFLARVGSQSVMNSSKMANWFTLEKLFQRHF